MEGVKAEDDFNDPGHPYHIPVLLNEAVRFLEIKPDGIYVDCTFGGGGHACAILEKLGPNGRLFAFDQDAAAQTNKPTDSRLVFVPENFRHIGRFLRLHEVDEVNGILADLGVSSHQLDTGERGFSHRFESDLDMRMDRRKPLTAARVVQEYSAESLQRIFQLYGEVTNARTLAGKIVERRMKMPVGTVTELKAAVHDCVKGNPARYFSQVFQALRIEVNDELGALEELLRQSAGLLKPGGRMVVITFHSLEDRLVKNFFKGQSEGEGEFDWYGRHKTAHWKVITRKPISPGEEELRKNPRSRSARIRAAEKK
jgi:16S rRNA (cytosine1402-N4)-methyltransferase